MRAKDAVGRFGEAVATRYLLDAGWRVIARNWRGTGGEVDIVAVEPGGDLVVVEVKARRSGTYGSPAEAVTAAKLRRLRRLAAEWLAAQEESFPGVRVDVIAVQLQRSGAAKIEHLRGVT